MDIVDVHFFLKFFLFCLVSVLQAHVFRVIDGTVDVHFFLKFFLYCLCVSGVIN